MYLVTILETYFILPYSYNTKYLVWSKIPQKGISKFLSSMDFLRLLVSYGAHFSV